MSLQYSSRELVFIPQACDDVDSVNGEGMLSNISARRIITSVMLLLCSYLELFGNKRTVLLNHGSSCSRIFIGDDSRGFL